MRLASDNGDLLEPAEFMPLAKKYSLMLELDYWVVENALMALNLLQSDGKDTAFSINLSASTLADAKALNRIFDIFSENPMPKRRVCIDLTEIYAIRNLETVTSFMAVLKKSGVEFALDDFENGPYSFACFQKLPLNYLKMAS